MKNSIDRSQRRSIAPSGRRLRRAAFLGCLFASFNTWVCLVRKKWAKKFWARILEVCVISVLTSSILFILPIAGQCQPCTSSTPETCIAGASEFVTFGGYRCHEPGHFNDLAVLSYAEIPARVQVQNQAVIPGLE